MIATRKPRPQPSGVSKPLAIGATIIIEKQQAGLDGSVIDQHGNKWYPAPATVDMESGLSRVCVIHSQRQPCSVCATINANAR